MAEEATRRHPQPASHLNPSCDRIDSIKIREAKIVDCVAIADIYNEAIADKNCTFDEFPVFADRYYSYISGDLCRSQLLVGTAAGEVVAWASVEPISDRHAYRFTALGSCYVSSHYRNQGIGSKMLSEMDAVAGSLGYHSIVGEILSTNPRSLAMDINHGYSVVGEIREAGLREGRRIGLIVVQKMLSDGSSS